MASAIQVVVLQTKGDTKQSKIEFGEDEDEDVLPTKIAKLLRKTKPPTQITTWSYQKLTLQLWGYKEGRSGTENKHELAPPVEGTQLYGDAVVVALLETGEFTNITTAQYTKFYSQVQGIDDSDDESDSDEEDEEEEIMEEAIDEDIIEEEDEDESSDDEDEDDDDDAAEDADGDAAAEVAVAKTAAKREYSSTAAAASRNKKIPKWALQPELEPEEYI